MNIELLNYDSKLFGYPIGNLYINKETSFNERIILEKIKKKYKLIYIISEYPIKTNCISFKHADNKVIFVKNMVNETKNQKCSCSPYQYNEYDYDSLRKLAFECGKYSRFRTDTNFINNEYEKLYDKWIKESVSKTRAMEVLVYRRFSKITGFITIVDRGNNIAQIELLAVNPEYQGKGIGSRLIRDAEDFVKLRGFIKMQVATQHVNKNAIILYKKNGYEIQTILYRYHFWNRLYT
jgi:dTDP-4-amino-4,6-dideoxy-D-galactose acyltransferase